MPPLFVAHDCCCAAKSGGMPSFQTSNWSMVNPVTLRLWTCDFDLWNLAI